MAARAQKLMTAGMVELGLKVKAKGTTPLG
jgi:hypothetical protein